jgi:hypothetical protein
MSDLWLMGAFLSCAALMSLLFVGAAVLALRQQSGRTRDLRSEAERLDLRFVGKDPAHLAELGPFPWLEARQPELWNLVTGEQQGFAVSIFEYGGDLDLVQTVAVFRDPSLRLPSFSMNAIALRAVLAKQVFRLLERSEPLEVQGREGALLVALHRECPPGERAALLTHALELASGLRSAGPAAFPRLNQTEVH